MRYEFDTYTTSDGELEISFLFVEERKEEWKAYILTEIDYKKYNSARDDSLNNVHRLFELSGAMKERVRNFIEKNGIPYTSESIYYVCWTQKISNLENIRLLAQTWAELTNCYIKFGGSFGIHEPRLRERGIISI